MILRARTSAGHVLVLGVLMGLFAASRPSAQEPMVARLWTERVLAEIPNNHFPNTLAWDSWLALAADLSRVAYADRYRTGEWMRETVVIDGMPGPQYLYASRPVLSPDGKHLAYLAVPEANSDLPAFLVVGTAKIQIQIKDRLLGPGWIPVFSPDSRRLLFRAERPGGKYAIGVIDLGASADSSRQPEITWGPEFLDFDRPRWSPDSSTYTYAGRRSQDEWHVVVGTEVRAKHRDASDARIRADGTLMYLAMDEKKKLSFVIGTARGPAFDAVTEPSFKADGTLVYGASEGARHFIVIGADRTEVPHQVEGVSVSADGARVMSWYREGPGGHQRMVMNGVPGRYFSRVSRPVLHADAGTFVYTAQDQRGFYVVTPLGVSGELPGVQWNPRISDDGTRTGYATVIGNQIVWKVAPLR